MCNKPSFHDEGIASNPSLHPSNAPATHAFVSASPPWKVKHTTFVNQILKYSHMHILWHVQVNAIVSFFSHNYNSVYIKKGMAHSYWIWIKSKGPIYYWIIQIQWILSFLNVDNCSGTYSSKKILKQMVPIVFKNDMRFLYLHYNFGDGFSEIILFQSPESTSHWLERVANLSRFTEL